MRNGKDSFEQRLDVAVTYFINMGMNLHGSYLELWKYNGNGFFDLYNWSCLWISII